jgi:hypothetical protein
LCAALAFHHFPEKLKYGLAITALCHEAFRDFRSVIYCPAKIMYLSGALHENLIDKQWL